jgi:hypothetical protein
MSFLPPPPCLDGRPSGQPALMRRAVGKRRADRLVRRPLAGEPGGSERGVSWDTSFTPLFGPRRYFTNFQVNIE